MRVVHVYLDECAGDHLFLAVGDYPRCRVATLLAGNERHRYHLPPAVDPVEVAPLRDANQLLRVSLNSNLSKAVILSTIRNLMIRIAKNVMSPFGRTGLVPMYRYVLGYVIPKGSETVWRAFESN